MATRVIVTYTDYAAISNDGRRYEVHEGELSVTPAPGSKHQEISLNLAVALYQYVRARGLGKVLEAPIDCILSETTIVQPDIAYVEARRLDIISPRGIEGPPALVVEILSPSTIQIDRVVKRQLYARHGVPAYWIVDPEQQSVEAYTLSEGAYELVARLEGAQPAALPPFADLALDPAALWP